ncbi:MAG: ankyrin repeat domain-containing protein [Parachlamydiaceae bacterium]
MLSLCESHPASVYHVCSYLTNRERLQLGLSATTFLSFLKPLFMSLEHDFNCRIQFDHLNTEYQQFITNKTLMTMDADDFSREYTFGTGISQLKAQCRVAAYWKNLNESRLTYCYNPYLISDFTKIKNMADEAHTLASLLNKFKVKAPEAAMRHAASKLNSVSLHEFKLLCRHTSDINEPSTNGNTALHWALKAKNEHFAHVLLEHKANCTLKNKFDQTPLHFAALLESDNLAGKLMARGANLHAKDKDGKTPLDRAIQHKSVHCIALLKKKMKSQVSLG